MTEHHRDSDKVEMDRMWRQPMMRRLFETDVKLDPTLWETDDYQSKFRVWAKQHLPPRN